MANLDEVKALAAWMRSAGVMHARVGDIELTLVEMPPTGGDPDEGEEAPSPKRPASIEDEPDLFGAKDDQGVPRLPDYGSEEAEAGEGAT